MREREKDKMQVKRLKALIAEDEIIWAMDLSQRLESNGCQLCELAITGDEAVETATRERPDVVILDINLKGEVSGLHAAQQIRLRLEIPVIFMTGYSDEVTRTAAMALEPAGYFIKPLEIEKLLALIDSLFDSKRD